MAEQSSCCLQRGQYLGEISALCFLHLPPDFSSLPFLLAGTGSQILVYDLTTGKMIKSFDVFDGIRVHGVSLQTFNEHLSGSHVTLNIAVYGERRVKVFSLQIQRVSNSQTEQQACFHLTLSLLLLLPKFSHWVLDVSFLKWDGATSSNNGDCLAIGCSDNSVHIWDMLRCSLLSRVRCSERCLLYSMRIWGDDVGSLRVASGTILNEVLVWKVGCKAAPDVIGSPTEDVLHLTSHEGRQLPCQQYEAVNICKLIGHEGSIFRLAWSADGFKLVSVSDDRSARIWTLGANASNHVVDSVLFGHSARIWDCYIFDSLIITAGEDCTCRVWGMDGTQLTRIREHV
uniref:WD repeat-containing protein 6-like n=1 Tax=Nicotiana tabacum TaxID=4097 RepID=A0A1S4CYN0_TOBAC|nr:PREDICTED: WD repeat-containing protein 6-like [Nicotiana tabacum]